VEAILYTSRGDVPAAYYTPNGVTIDRETPQTEIAIPRTSACPRGSTTSLAPTPVQASKASSSLAAT
jgi:hypothetical protein